MTKPSIKKLDEDDWKIYKQIRLEALKSDPTVFGSTFTAESARTEEEWREPLRSEKGAIFVLISDGLPKGITGIVMDREDAEGATALLWGSWLAPELRGKGLSRLFYEARLAWAREHPTVKRIVVSHRASNHASKRANQRYGFVVTHVTNRVWNDGIREDEIHYEMVL